MISGADQAGRDVMDIAECSLAELMEDPLIGLVMKSDGVERCELELLLERVVHDRHANRRQHTVGFGALLPTMGALPC
jgi:hypothetical protein